MGFTLFYAPIFFVNQIGLSATTVGIALDSSSICAVGSLVLAAINNFVTHVIGNLINGLGVGLYWSVYEPIVADLTNIHEGRGKKEVTSLRSEFKICPGGTRYANKIQILINK